MMAYLHLHITVSENKTYCQAKGQVPIPCPNRPQVLTPKFLTKSEKPKNQIFAEDMLLRALREHTESTQRALRDYSEITPRALREHSESN